MRLEAPLPHRVISRWWPTAERADHGPFTLRGVRAVHFYNRGQDGEWIDLAYHSPRDVISRVHRESLAEVGRLVLALNERRLPEHDGDGFWLPLATNIVVPRWALLVAELALVAIAATVFVRRRRPHGNGAGLWAGLLCYVLAVALAVAIERWFAGDHPAPWLHAPLRAELAGALVLAGGLGLATRAIGRRWPWTGEQRYVALAVAIDLAIGVGWLVAGAAELAWVWLLPAALAALAPRHRLLAVIGSAALVLPSMLVLAPSQVREAAWNGFLPTQLPLAAWLAVLLAPLFAMAAWWLRAYRGPLGSVILAVGSAVAVGAGVACTATSTPVCSPAEFRQFQLACEQERTWPMELHYLSPNAGAR